MFIASAGKAARNRVFFQNSVSFLGVYVSEPIYGSLLSGYNEMSTEPSNFR